MRYVKLQKEDLNEFLDRCKQLGEVHGPVKTRDSRHKFEKIEGADEMDLEYTRTMIPPTKYLIPPKQKMFTYKDGEYKEKIDFDKTVLFGVHPCDINAIVVLDDTYLDEELPDKYYKEARDNLFVIGHSCMPDEYCFCQSWGSEFAEEGFDLFFHELDGRYLVRVNTGKANDLVDNNGDLFEEEVDEEDIQELKEFQEEKSESFERSIDTNGLKDIMDLQWESDIWEKYSEQCFTCGSCTISCPTCICYDLEDRPEPDGSVTRERTWTSCFYKRHGLVADDENFRPSKLERFRHRYSCKNYFEDGIQNCVGCGRCIKYCQANIDHVEVLNDLIKTKAGTKSGMKQDK